MRVIVGNRRARAWWQPALFGAMSIAVVAFFGSAMAVAITIRRWANDLPEVPDLAYWRDHARQTTVIVAADGTHMAEIPFRDGRTVGHRTLAPVAALAPDLVRAVLAAEDVRFLGHRGVDYQALIRAAWINFKVGRVVGGASTITQQLARNLLPTEIGKARNLKRKVREALLARALENRWSKREILATYLDFVYLGQGAYGMVAAARAYFDCEIGDLTLAQSALLAGLIQAPGRLDPFHHPQAAAARRNEVLARMVRANLIDENARAAALSSPIVLHRPRRSRGTIAPWYAERVRRLIATALPHDRGGLVVETAALPALDAAIQRGVLQTAVRWSQPHAGRPSTTRLGPGRGDNRSAATDVPQVGALLWDYRTGYVEALIGGRAWSATSDQFDRMTQACRQPGSAWKPLVYGAALDAGVITPGTALRDAPIAEYDEATHVHWKPHSSGGFRGISLAQEAFAQSRNSPAIDVFDRVGPKPIIALARRLGVSSPLAEVQPMALGASCVRPIELAQAYAVIARGGLAILPRFVVRIRRGSEVLFDASVPADPQLDPARRFDRLAATAGDSALPGADGGELLDRRTAYQLVDMMAAVVQRGTASSARLALGRPAAGKTGTTNDNTDAWFIGFTARVVGAVWVGFDQPAVKLGPTGDGAHAALPLWMQAIQASEGTRPQVAVPGPPPAGLEQAVVDRETGFPAAAGAGGLELWFRTGTAPTGTDRSQFTPTDFGRASREF